MIACLFFFHTVNWSFILGQRRLLSSHFCKACQNCLRPSFEFVQLDDLMIFTMQCGCMHCCFVVKAPANAIMQRKQRQLGHKQFWHVLQNWLLSVQPSIAEYEWTMYRMKVEWLCYHALKSVYYIYIFFFFFYLESNPGFLFFYKSHCILIAAYLEKEQQEYGIFLKYLPYHCQMQHIFMVYIQQFWNTQESKINLLINAHLQSTFH